MGMPAMALTNITATGDIITAPGCPTILVGGLPAATMTHMVAGPACVSGVITSTVSPNVLLGGLPAATLTAVVAGVSPVGVPITTACAVTPNMNKIL